MDDEEFLIERKCTLNKIEIENPELWQVHDKAGLKNIEVQRIKGSLDDLNVSNSSF